MTRLRIFFAHQSVGSDILAGVRELAPEVPIVRGERPLTAPGIAEIPVGRNGSPREKLADFSRAMQQIGASSDVALMKFCYVDVTASTDRTALERAYRATMDAIAAAYPRTRVVHVTVPLTTTETGATAIVKRWIGRPLAGEADNRARAEFNAWLRDTYRGRPIFDVAAAEARTPAGGDDGFALDGRVYPRLHAAYSTDGGHLGPAGRRAAAAALLDVLDRIAREPRP